MRKREVDEKSVPESKSCFEVGAWVRKRDMDEKLVPERKFHVKRGA